jgi:hypothetical protein
MKIKKASFDLKALKLAEKEGFELSSLKPY